MTFMNVSFGNKNNYYAFRLESKAKGNGAMIADRYVAKAVKLTLTLALRVQQNAFYASTWS